MKQIKKHPKSIPQGKALQALKDNSFKGLLTMCTGSGKSKVAIDAILEMEKNKNEKENNNTYYLFIPRIDLRDENWKEEFAKWDAMHIYNDESKLKRHCYASMEKAVKEMQEDLENGRKVCIILDEAHHLTLNKAEMLPDRTYFSSVIALTATPDEQLKDYLKSFLDTDHIFDYPLSKAIDDEVIPQYGIVLWKVPLSEAKDVKVEYKDKRTGKDKSFMTSCKEQYDYINKKYMGAVQEMGAHINMAKMNVKRALNMHGFTGVDDFVNKLFTFNPTDNAEWQKIKYDKVLRKISAFTNREVVNLSRQELDKLMKLYKSKSYMIDNYGRKRTTAIYNSTDKLELGIKIYRMLKEESTRFIYFAPNISKALEVDKDALHSKRSDKKNREIMERFNNGETNCLVNVNKVNEGTNLEGIESAVIQQFTSKTRTMTQRVGRALRSKDSPLIHIVVLKDTHDERWLELALKDFNKDYIYTIELENDAQGRLDFKQDAFNLIKEKHKLRNG